MPKSFPQVTAAELTAINPAAEAFFGKQAAFIQHLRYQGVYRFEKDVWADLKAAVPRALKLEESPWDLTEILKELEKRFPTDK